MKNKAIFLLLILSSLTSFSQVKADIFNYVSHINRPGMKGYEWKQLDMTIKILFDTVEFQMASIYLSDPYLTRRDVHIMFDKEGGLASFLCIYHNGNSLQVNYQQGRMFRRRESTADGETVEYLFFENGRINYERHFDSSGIGFEKEYSVSGEFIDIRFI